MHGMMWQRELQDRILEQNALLHRLTRARDEEQRSLARQHRYHSVPFSLRTWTSLQSGEDEGNSRLESLLIQNAQMQQMLMAHMLREVPSGSTSLHHHLSNQQRIDEPVHHANTGRAVTADYPLPVEVAPPAGYPMTEASSSWHGPVSRHNGRRKQRKKSPHNGHLADDGDSLNDREDDASAHGYQHTQTVSLPSLHSHISMESKRNRDAFLGISRPKKYPFPGNESSKRLRRLFWAALFCMTLLKNMQKGHVKRSQAVKRLETMIWNARSCLHQLLLSDDVPVKSIIRSVISKDAKHFLVKSRGLFRRATGDDTAALQALSSTTEQLLDEVMRITPNSSGVSHRLTACVWHLIQPRTVFPADYLWSLEKEYLSFDRLHRTKDVSTEGALVLFVCFFVIRCLIKTIVLNPQEHRISSASLSDTACSNLKTVASFVVYIIRLCLAGSKGSVKSVPEEIADSLYGDEEMKFVYRKLSQFVHSYQGQVTQWALRFLDEVKSERR